MADALEIVIPVLATRFDTYFSNCVTLQAVRNYLTRPLEMCHNQKMAKWLLRLLVNSLNHGKRWMRYGKRGAKVNHCRVSFNAAPLVISILPYQANGTPKLLSDVMMTTIEPPCVPFSLSLIVMQARMRMPIFENPGILFRMEIKCFLFLLSYLLALVAFPTNVSCKTVNLFLFCDAERHCFSS